MRTRARARPAPRPLVGKGMGGDGGPEGGVPCAARMRPSPRRPREADRAAQRGSAGDAVRSTGGRGEGRDAYRENGDGGSVDRMAMVDANDGWLELAGSRVDEPRQMRVCVLGEGRWHAGTQAGRQATADAGRSGRGCSWGERGNGRDNSAQARPEVVRAESVAADGAEGRASGVGGGAGS